ncbi:hypothetical protein F4561_002662 [Lipingzhangella halophila]|uniref:Uncharacterized protein n=1 Tax=Lipingzhangella halophila TaxID=1783352 RepID=A0A7W7W2C0_9ACTN|nr:hypothetical protein [Lipingzhangella halophila]
MHHQQGHAAGGDLAPVVVEDIDTAVEEVQLNLARVLL